MLEYNFICVECNKKKRLSQLHEVYNERNNDTYLICHNCYDVEGLA